MLSTILNPGAEIKEGFGHPVTPFRLRVDERPVQMSLVDPEVPLQDIPCVRKNSKLIRNAKKFIRHVKTVFIDR
jgi:hypothetical protein